MNPPPSPLHLPPAGCLSGILHRLLCSRRDSEHAAEKPASSFQGFKNIADASPPPLPPKKPPSPSLVARLMGLDSMPVHPYAPPPDSIPRSRSANSADTWTGFLSHKRAVSDPPSSLSFREAPTYLKKENDDFLLLSFIPEDTDTDRDRDGDGDGEGEDPPLSNLGTPKNKMRTTLERQPRNGRRDCCRQNGRSQSCVGGCSVPSKKRGPHKNARRRGKAAEMAQHEQETRVGESKDIRRRRSAYAHRKLELEYYCSSQNSSPVSVLDRRKDGDCECELSPETPVPVDRKPKKRGSRRKLSSDLDRRGASRRIDISKKRSGNGRMRLIDGGKKNRTKGDRHDFLEMLGMICRMAEEDAKATSWVSDDVGEVVSEIGMEILEFLLSELVLELSEPMVAV